MTKWEKIKAGHVFSFKGGITPSENKEYTENIATTVLPNPKKLVIPIKVLPNSDELLVKVGDHVVANQALTNPKRINRQVPIHTALSGTVTEIDLKPIAHASGLSEPCVVIEVDEKQNPEEAIYAPKYPNFKDIDPLVLLKQIRDMGVAGLGGAGFPTDVKLKSNVGEDKPRCEILIVNGAECEPYITCDDRIMQEYSDQIIQGICVLQHILKPKFTVVAIEDNKPTAIANINAAIQKANLADTRVTVLPVKYPSGAARNLIKLITDVEVPYNARSADYGCIVQNVGTVYAVADAIINGQALTKRIVTVTGKAIGKPSNIWVPIGTSVNRLLVELSYKMPKVPRIIAGGPMMGFTLPTSNVPIDKTTNCILTPADEELMRTKPQLPCIRCGRCAHVCPSRLVPFELYNQCRNNEFDKAVKSGVRNCVECACCAYVCPSAIRLVGEIRVGKAQMKKEKQQAEKLRISKERFNAKQIRVAEEERIRAERKAAALAKAKAMQAAKAQGTSSNVASTTAKVTENTLKENSSLMAPVKNSELTPEQRAARKAEALAKAKAMKEARLKAQASSNTENTAPVKNAETKTVTEAQTTSKDTVDTNLMPPVKNSELTPEQRAARKAEAIAKAKAMKEARLKAQQEQQNAIKTEEGNK